MNDKQRKSQVRGKLNPDPVKFATAKLQPTKGFGASK
jgi:hypothetical protein